MLSKALPIRYILLGAFLLAGLLPTLLITGMAFYEARSALKTEIKRDMTTRAIATADEVDRMMFERLQNVASWSQLEIMQEIRIDDVDKRLSKFLSDLKQSYRDIYVELYVVNNQGMIVASSNIQRIGQPHKPIQPWQKASLPQTQISLGAIDHARLPILATIYSTSTEAPVGQLVAVFDWLQVQHVLESAVTGRSAAALYDNQQHLLSSTSRWHAIHLAKKLSSHAKTNGYQNFAGFDWRVDILQNRAQAMTPVRQMAFIFLALLLVTVALATLIAVPVARAITRPIAKLTNFALGFMRAPSNLAPPRGGPAEIDAMSHAFARMIEDLERSKENLTRAAKLAVVGEMAAAMSHEVRTPLGILRSSAQVLLREPTLSEEGREVCGFIISETERLNKLVSTLIDSARPRLPNFTPVDISQLCSQSAAMLRMQAEKKHIALETQLNAGLIAICDPEQMTQVLLNLLLNAIQVLPEGGRIVLGSSTAGEHACITVSDNGPGIPEEQREQVFDPFFTKRSGGIGLGLSVVRQIVQAHHGSIRASTSTLGGAEFRILLPLSGVEN
jgi:two-component system, NtrC family, sensor histidine kinase HydH